MARRNDASVLVRLDARTLARLDAAAEARRVPRLAVIREALLLGLAVLDGDGPDEREMAAYRRVRRLGQ